MLKLQHNNENQCIGSQKWTSKKDTLSVVIYVFGTSLVNLLKGDNICNKTTPTDVVKATLVPKTII